MHVLSFKWHRSCNHGIEEDPKTPYIGLVALIALITDDLRSNISRGSTLFINLLGLTQNSTHSKVTDLDVSFLVYENIVKLNVSMED